MGVDLYFNEPETDGVSEKEIRDAVEEAIEDLDGTPRNKQVNLLGNKKKYVNAIVKKLVKKLK